MTELYHGFDMTPWPSGAEGRELYFERIKEEVKNELEKRGYRVVMLGHLPRGSALQERTYLLKKAQGIEVGTVEVSQTQENALRLLFKHTGLLDENRGSPGEKVQQDKQSVLELIEEGRSHRSRLTTRDTTYGRDVGTMLDELPGEDEES